MLLKELLGQDNSKTINENGNNNSNNINKGAGVLLTRSKTKEHSLVPLVGAITSVMEASEFNVPHGVHVV